MRAARTLDMSSLGGSLRLLYACFRDGKWWLAPEALRKTHISTWSGSWDLCGVSFLLPINMSLTISGFWRRGRWALMGVSRHAADVRLLAQGAHQTALRARQGTSVWGRSVFARGGVQQWQDVFL